MNDNEPGGAWPGRRGCRRRAPCARHGTYPSSPLLPRRLSSSKQQRQPCRRRLGARPMGVVCFAGCGIWRERRRKKRRAEWIWTGRRPGSWMETWLSSGGRVESTRRHLVTCSRRLGAVGRRGHFPWAVWASSIASRLAASSRRMCIFLFGSHYPCSSRPLMFRREA